MPTEHVRPVHEIRLGRIKSVIWPVDGSNGRFYSATITRIYKDGVTWKESSSFSRDDLPLVAKVADLTHTWMFSQNKAQENSQNQESENPAGEF